MNDEDRLYLRQLLAGEHIAVGDEFATQMRNFVYLVGDRANGEAVVVDPAWDVAGIVAEAAADGMRLVGALATHHHRDHVGGHMFGQDVEGIVDLAAHADVPLHVQRDEAEWVGVASALPAGDVTVELLHTPGHTPGSQCLLVDGRYLISGDTLFIDGCGRTDLPGGDPEALYRSLTEVLGRVGDQTYVLPGHLYSPEAAAPMGVVRERNVVYRARTQQQFLAMFSR